MLAFRGDIRLMQLMNSLGDAAGEFNASRSGQKSRSCFARHFALKPHLEPRNHAERLRHGYSIGAGRIKTCFPKLFEQAVALLPEALRTRFANDGDRFRRRSRPLYADIIFHDAALARLVANHANGFQTKLAGFTRQAWQASLKLF